MRVRIDANAVRLEIVYPESVPGTEAVSSSLRSGLWKQVGKQRRKPIPTPSGRVHVASPVCQSI